MCLFVQIVIFLINPFWLLHHREHVCHLLGLWSEQEAPFSMQPVLFFQSRTPLRCPEGRCQKGIEVTVLVRPVRTWTSLLTPPPPLN